MKSLCIRRQCSRDLAFSSLRRFADVYRLLFIAKQEKRLSLDYVIDITTLSDLRIHRAGEKCDRCLNRFLPRRDSIAARDLPTERRTGRGREGRKNMCRFCLIFRRTRPDERAAGRRPRRPFNSFEPTPCRKKHN